MTYTADGYSGGGQFDAGRVLARMGGVLRRDFPVLAGLALLLSGAPNLLLGLAGFASMSLNPETLGPLGLVFAWPFSAVISVLLQAALIHGTISDLNGRRASFADCLGTALRHVLPLLGIGFCVTAACLFGLLFFIVPGVILSLMLCVAAPVQVVEGLGVFACMSRSADLTRDHRGVILGLFLLYALVGGMLGAATSASILPATVHVLLDPLLQAASALVGSAGIASVYFELRVIKDGIGAEALAAAFD